MAIPWLIGAAVVGIGVAIKKALDSNDSTNDDDEESERQLEREAKKQRKRKNLEKKIVNIEQEFYAGLPERVLGASQVLGIIPGNQNLEITKKEVFPMTERSQFEEEIDSYRQSCEKNHDSECISFLKMVLGFSSINALENNEDIEKDFSNNIFLLERLLGHDVDLEQVDRQAFLKMKHSLGNLDRYSKIRKDLIENA